MLEYTSSLAQTRQLAQRLAKSLDKGCFIAFNGDLGAGKTAFISGLVKALGCNAPVSSPTFALMNQYLGGRLPVYHFDLYRIEGDEIYSLGFDEIFYDQSSVKCVEWSERLAEADMPPKRIEITVIRLDGDNRCFSIKPVGYSEGEMDI